MILFLDWLIHQDTATAVAVVGVGGLFSADSSYNPIFDGELEQTRPEPA